MKSPTAAVSKATPFKSPVTEEGSTNTQDGKFWPPKEQDGPKNNLTAEKCFKRCKALLEDSPTKKCRSEGVELPNVLPVSSDEMCSSFKY